MEELLKRDRLIIAASLFGICAIAWGYMIREAWGMTVTGICCCAGMKMSGPDMNPWAASTLLPLALMWGEMMVAMMLPSAAPVILLFATVNRRRRETAGPFVPTAIFVAGYLIVWTVFSGLAALAQWALHGRALLSPMMVSTSPWLAGFLLIAAGIFQWSPLDFLMNDWRNGKLGALSMGLRHGVYCTGCCWLLMALLFVAGVMNMWWVAVITVFVLLEKAAARGPHIAKLAGLVLVLWGACTIATAA